MLNIFAFGSGYIEFGIMQAIAQMFSGNQMNVLFASMMALGGVMVAVMTLISGYDRPGSHLTLAKYLLGAMFVYGVLIVPRVTVHIEDTVINTQSNAYVVTGVPFGIGGIMSLFSNIQMDLTQLVETNFSTPQSIDLTNAGMGLSLTSENLADNITISDPYLKRDFTQFTYNCIMPGMSAAGGIDMFDLDMAGAATDNSSATYNSNTAASFWSVVSAYTAGAGANEITTWYSGNGTVTGAASGGDYPQGLTTTCGQETAWMNTAMEYYIDNDAGPALAGSLGETWSQFSTEYGQINSSVYNMSNGATSQFEQMALTNEFSNAVIDSAKLAGLNANSVAYGTAMAQENMNNSFLISGVMASQYLPVAYGIISSLVMAFSVILLLLLFLPTGVNYLKMYFELLMFITVWPPLMAIYNYITDLIIQHNSASLAGEGFSILTAHSYSTFTSSYLGWVGYMSWSIPMLAYALVTGSTYAMVATLSSVDSAGKSSASAGAKVASTGDLSLGNDSLDNYSGDNKSMHNLSAMDVSAGNRRTNNTMEGTKTFASNTAAGNNLVNGISGGALNDKNFNGTVTNTGGEVAMSGQVNRQGLENMIKDGDLKGNALTNAEDQLKQNPNAKEFGLNASGTASGGFSSIKISRAQQASNVNTGDINHSSKETLTGKPNQSFGGMDVSGLSGNISKIGNQVSATSLTGSKASLENFVKTNDPKSLGKAEKFLNKNPNSVLSFTSGGNGKMNSLGLKSSFNADHVNLTKDTTGSQKAKYNSSLVDDTHLTKLGSLTTNNNGYQGWSGSKIIHDNINNRNNERFTNNKFGSQSWRGNSHTIDNSITRKAGTFYQSPDYGSNQAFLNEGSYIGNYAKYTPGGAGIISGMKAKQTGAFATFNQNTQGMLEQYGGNINTLTFSADAKDTIKAQGGLNLLGNKLENEVTASVGVNGQSQIRANALRTDVGNQLTKYGDEYKNGKISWSKYQNNANGLVSTYKTLINVGSAPSGATAVNLGRNAIASASNGTIEQSELEANNPNELPGNLT